MKLHFTSCFVESGVKKSLRKCHTRKTGNLNKQVKVEENRTSRLCCRLGHEKKVNLSC